MKRINVNQAKSVENPPGVARKTITYNGEVMLCHFVLRKGAQIPLHEHRATQAGYLMKGKVRFLMEKPNGSFEAGQGDSYVFDPFTKHGCIALEDSEYVEAFTPARDEYKDF